MHWCRKRKEVALGAWFRLTMSALSPTSCCRVKGVWTEENTPYGYDFWYQPRKGLSAALLRDTHRRFLLQPARVRRYPN